ncbi:MAG TPA: potassium channel family protein [Humisphaera sp.]
MRCVLGYAGGTALVLLALADVFMTVLYARAGTGPVSHRLAAGGWAVVRRVARRLAPARRDALLGYFGPGYLVTLLAVWFGLLLLGFTLLTWPGLGGGIVRQDGPTPTDLLTAFHFAGGSLTTVGTGDLQPKSAFYRVLTVIDSVIGISVVTLAMTYVLQLYTALQRRNTLALGLHHASGGTGDAAALLAGLGPGDDFSHGDGQLSALAAEVTGVFESHHFYSVLVYFRFREPRYATARGALVVMELVTLIDTALDERRHGWLRRSSAVTQAREGGMQVLTENAAIYLPGGAPATADPSPEAADRWRRRYRAAVGHLVAAGISVTADPDAGADRYVALRRHWDPHVAAFARYMEHAIDEIDPAGADPAETGRHREMPTPPLRRVG